MVTVTDFRTVIQNRLLEKVNQLGDTESTLKKYGGEGENKFRHRLGPPRKIPIGLRLGPKVSDIETTEEVSEEPVSIKSRIVVEIKSREEALEEAKKIDRSDMQRNRRMFGNLLGTLQKFRQDESRVKERENKKRNVEKKIEEKTELEKREARKEKEKLFLERQKQKYEIKILQCQMARLEEYEEWESSKRKEMAFIRTKVGPPLYYSPKVHNDKTLNALEETMDVVEEEIKATKIKFQDDLLKIEAKISADPHGDPDDDDEESEYDNDSNGEEKPKSIVVVTTNEKLPTNGSRNKRRKNSIE